MKYIDFLYSLFFCLRYLPLRQALKVPILISLKVKTHLWRGAIVIDNDNVKRYMITIGYKGYSLLSSNSTLLVVEKDSHLVFKGSAIFAQGCRIWIERGNTLEIGDNFYCNKNGIFRCADNVTFGNNVLIGWDVLFNTTDGHFLINEGNIKNNHGTISVGNNVWIASYSKFQKGTKLADWIVVAQNSLVCNRFNESNCLIGGALAKIIKTNISWRI